mmetsp:Transcript_66724/g.145514  ORF Transcript_66724/g.145514 Transcript_66724/m.145514 type:complete len:308 (+) Transcript_66724:151-1074(+)
MGHDSHVSHLTSKGPGARRASSDTPPLRRILWRLLDVMRFSLRRVWSFRNWFGLRLGIRLVLLVLLVGSILVEFFCRKALPMSEVGETCKKTITRRVCIKNQASEATLKVDSSAVPKHLRTTVHVNNELRGNFGILAAYCGDLVFLHGQVTTIPGPQADDIAGANLLSAWCGHSLAGGKRELLPQALFSESGTHLGPLYFGKLSVEGSKVDLVAKEDPGLRGRGVQRLLQWILGAPVPVRQVVKMLSREQGPAPGYLKVPLNGVGLLPVPEERAVRGTLVGLILQAAEELIDLPLLHLSARRPGSAA